jgi:Tol biopolymer transport system component
LEALVEALIEEARQRARRRRRRNTGYALLVSAIGLTIYAGIVRAAPASQPAAAARSEGGFASQRSIVSNGPLTLFVPGTNSTNAGSSASIETIGQGRPKTIWRCPRNIFCGQPVSFAWAPDGRRIAFTLDEVGGMSTYVGMHVVNVVTGRDTQVPPGAPTTMSAGAWSPYLQKMMDRVGCWPATELAWSPDGSSLAYRCDRQGSNLVGETGGPHINILRLAGSGYTTVHTGTLAFWPSWSPSGTRIAYATSLIRPTPKSRIYTVALDGSQRRLVASNGTAPAWSPDGRTIAYQTRCGIRLVTPTGKDVTPQIGRNSCGAIGVSGPPVWSPDGRKLAVETPNGVYVMDANGGRLHMLSYQATTTWYGTLPGRPAWQAAR